ncbi:diacylglycerol/lipid kinase family protein [Riemerella columbina]|uniref:diacylglycerol/lipid kinase family protein n=1 Tax=Riemerella columbina TaxID=103810 RepID=UPI00266EE719|nr:diacylglycerol kinase family protein [Riemerella columbina]WKS96091.1 diacylglycerol kinase [Riemerella columbina]
MQNVAFIINPFSAKGQYQHFLAQCQEKMPEAHYYISESLEGTRQFIAQHMADTDIFIAMGGDGTISSIAQHLIHTDKILGIYPAGSGNGFANEMNFDKKVDHLINKIKRAQSKTIDTFKINNHFSINVSGLGFDGAVAKDFEKTSRGFLNYIKVCIRTFFKYKPIKISFDDAEHQPYNGEYLMLNVANTRQFGNNAYIAPQASDADGLLEIALIKKFPLWYSGIFAARLFSKSLKENRYVKYWSVPALRFHTDGQDWHLDGEYTPIASPVEVQILPQSLKILV